MTFLDIAYLLLGVIIGFWGPDGIRRAYGYWKKETKQ